jgi:hypothetical protein
MVKDIVPGSASSTPFNFVAVAGAVEFFAFDSSSESSNGLFRSDGTATGTFELAMNVGTSTPLPVTASPDGDFNGDSFSDILWQNEQRPSLDLGYARKHPDQRGRGHRQSRTKLASCGLTRRGRPILTTNSNPRGGS